MDHEVLYNISSKGRTFVPGKALGEETRSAIADKIISLGGDIATGFFPGSFTEVADTFQVWPESVRKVWRLVCSEGNVTPRPRNLFGTVFSVKSSELNSFLILKQDYVVTLHSFAVTSQNMSVSPPPKQLFWELYSVIYSRGFIIHIKLDHKMTDISSR